MGPFELMDMIGHDVNFAVTKSVFEAYFNDPRFTPSLVQQELGMPDSSAVRLSAAFTITATTLPCRSRRPKPPALHRTP